MALLLLQCIVVKDCVRLSHSRGLVLGTERPLAGAILSVPRTAFCTDPVPVLLATDLAPPPNTCHSAWIGLGGAVLSLMTVGCNLLT